MRARRRRRRHEHEATAALLFVFAGGEPSGVDSDADAAVRDTSPNARVGTSALTIGEPTGDHPLAF